MDKKPLIGVNILAVVLLVLGSLINVVGYQSVKSTGMSESPLFNVRTKRATNQQQNIITSQYLGMGKGNLLRIPMRDNKTESLIKVLEYISKMDNVHYAQFTNLVIIKIHQNPAFNNVKDNDIKKMLQLFRDPTTLLNLYTENRSLHMQTIDGVCLPSINIWTPGCFILVFFLWLYNTILYNLYIWPQIIKWVIQSFIGNFFTLSPCVTSVPCPH